MTLKLDGRPVALLNFKASQKEALMKIARGEPLVWELDLGLETGFPRRPFLEADLRAQMLAVDHFLGTLWAEFHVYTSALVLYRGALDFDPKDLSNTLALLSANIPDRLPLELHFTGEASTSLELAQKTSRALFPRYDVFWQGKRAPFRSEKATVGFLLPSDKHEAFDDLLKQGIEPRVVTEAYLTGEWDGLDSLWVTPSCLTPEGHRKLKGFMAAGGEVINL